MLDIKLTIPFTSKDTDNSRSKILLYLDDELLCDGSIYNSIKWILRLIHLMVKSLIQNQEINIPHIHFNGIKYTKEPKLNGTLVIIGYNLKI